MSKYLAMWRPAQLAIKLVGKTTAITKEPEQKPVEVNPHKPLRPETVASWTALIDQLLVNLAGA